MAMAISLANRLEEALWRLCKLIPHLERLGDDRFEFQSPPMVWRALRKVGAQTSRHNSQTFQGLGAVISELLVALHLAAEGPVPKGPVFNHPDRGGGEIVPAIGPTVWWWWLGSRRISPFSNMFMAASIVAQPS